MKHLGDINRIIGYEIPPVDAVTGGSPCQDLSVAGRRAGLSGERSGLFMEQIRVVREMRERDRARGRAGHMVRPRYMVWENVPGAFSSGNPKGADFAAVIEEIIKICEPEAAVSVCVPDKGWPKSGCYYADDGSWSVAWRVHDAQYWGVPQRRKRIALVADFGGLSAPEILFERKGLSWDVDESKAAGEETAGGTGGSAESTSWCLKGNTIDRDTDMNGRWANENVSFTLNATDRRGVVSAGFRYKASASADGVGYQPECSATLNAEQPMGVFDARGSGDGQISPILTDEQPVVIEPRSHDGIPRIYKGGVVPTLNTAQGGQRQPCVCVGNGQLNQISMTEQANTLDTMHDQQAVLCYVLDSNKNGCAEQTGAIQSHASGGATEFCVDCQAVVRRLTPLECERLQGYPDGWTDIGEWTDSKGNKRQTTDTARYKALGNSIALPFWFWLLRRISAQYERPATLGSLFDGIGGFPLCWERCNGKGTAIWASEIEEFCVAVTKRRLGDG